MNEGRGNLIIENNKLYLVVDNIISSVRSSIAPWKLFIPKVKVFVDRDFEFIAKVSESL
jgi:hypothetical protein